MRNTLRKLLAAPLCAISLRDRDIDGSILVIADAQGVGKLRHAANVRRCWQGVNLFGKLKHGLLGLVSVSPS